MNVNASTLARAAAAAVVALSLSGCASFLGLRIDVATPNPAPPALVGAEVQLQAAPADATGPAAGPLRDAVLRAMTRAGLRPVLDAPAPYAARYAFGSVVDLDAMFPMGWPPPPLMMQLPDGRWIGRPYGWSPWFPDTTQYALGFEVEIRDVRSGALLWSSVSSLSSFASNPVPVAGALAAAAFDGFPAAAGRRTVVENAP